MEKKPEEEVVEEEVIEVPVDVKEEDVAPPEAPQPDVLKEAHDVLCAWHELYKVEQPKADDTFYYAKELWVEDEKFWDHGKHKVTRGQWTVEQFDEELEKLRKKQQPVWDKLLKQADEIAAKLEKPAADVNASAEKVEESIGPHPLQKYVGKPAPTKLEAEVRHEYHWKLHQEFEDAKAQYQEICGHPEGLLSRVKLFRINVVREDISITEYIHSDKKTVGKFFKNLPLLRKIGA